MTVVNKKVIIESCSAVVLSSSESVELANDSKFQNAAQNLQKKIKNFDSFKQWKENELNPQSFDDFCIDWIFLCDLLNFSFWKDENGPSFEVEFEGKIYKSYWSLPATLNKSKFLVDPKFYSKISLNEFDQIFNPNIPLKLERIRLMNEAGKLLVENYDGSFANFLKATGTSDAWHFINCLIKEFQSFRDYNDELSVWFLKRAQILVADLWAASGGKLFSESIKDLTIFADYRIPQVLNYMGLIRYNQSLQDQLNRKVLIPSRQEAEIRAASIIACEKLKDLLGCCNSVELDFYLWEYSQKIKDQIDLIYPFHRTRSIYY